MFTINRASVSIFTILIMVFYTNLSHAAVGDKFAFRCKSVGIENGFTLKMLGEVVENNVGTDDEIVVATLYLPPNEPLPYYVGHYDSRIPRFELHYVHVDPVQGDLVADFSEGGQSTLYLNGVLYELNCKFIDPNEDQTHCIIPPWRKPLPDAQCGFPLG